MFFEVIVYKSSWILAVLLFTCAAHADRCLECFKTPLRGTMDEFDCSNCSLKEVPKFPLSAKRINLSTNKITTILNDTFLEMPDLRELNIEGNELSKIEICKGRFSSIRSLRKLNLHNNKLTDTSLNNLYCLQDLRILNIRRNVYKHYPNSISTFLNLKELYMDVFQNFSCDKTFLSLKKLTNLVLEAREMLTLGNNSFEGFLNSPIKNLTLNLAGKVYGHIGINFLYPFRFLERLNLNIRGHFDIIEVLKVMYGLRGRKLESIDVKGNNWDAHRYHDLTVKEVLYLFTICVKEINLSYNNIYHFPFLESLNTNFSYCLERLYMADQRLFWTASELIGIFSFPSLKLFYVPIPYSYNREVYESSKYQLSKPFKYHFNVTSNCWKTIEYIDISGINIGATFNDLELFNLFLDLPNLNVLAAPTTSWSLCNYEIHLNANVSYLDMSGWNCSNINPLFLRSFRNVSLLNASRSKIGQQLNTGKSQTMLHKLFRLEHLDLSYNSINYLSDTFFYDQAHSLNSIDLSHNNLRSIPQALVHLQQVTVIDLSYNNFEFLNKNDMRIIENMENATFILKDNFECTCKYIDSLVWIKKARNVNETIICRESRNVMMSSQNLRSFQLKCLSIFWLDFSITAFFLVLLMIIATALGYMNKSLVVYFCIKARRFVKKTNNDMQINQYRYDAFVSYSHLDDDWVTGPLYRYLTRHLCLEICLHQKDFLPDAPIAEEILRCVESSRKSLFVITRNFLRSKWSLFEMDIARHHVLQSDSDTLIVILKEDIPVHEMPMLLRKIWWRIVCLKYPQDENQQELDLFNKKLSEIFQK